MNKNSAAKQSTIPHTQLANDLRNNPGNTQCLARLVQSHFKSGNYQRAVKLLKNIIQGPEFNTYTINFRAAAIQYAKITIRQLVTIELNAGRIAEAHKFYDRLARLAATKGVIQQTGSPAIPDVPQVETSQDLPPLAPDMNNASDRLAASLLERNWLTDAVRILGNKNCHVSYPMGVKIMQQYASSQATRKVPAIKRNIDLLNKLLTILDVNEDIDSIEVKSIYSNVLYPLSPWREKTLSQYDLEEMNRWIDLSGTKFLEQASKTGKGIVLVNSHISTGRLAIMLLNMMGYKMNSIELRNNMEIFGVPAARGIRVLELGETASFPLRQLYLAKNALEKGEIVNIAGDGLKGGKGVPAKFVDRLREFRPGFANLATMSGATVLPVFGSVDLTGKVYIEIKAPLDKGDAGLTDAEKTENLITRYSLILQEQWRKNPADIKWEHIDYFLSLPVIEEI